MTSAQMRHPRTRAHRLAAPKAMRAASSNTPTSRRGIGVLADAREFRGHAPNARRRTSRTTRRPGSLVPGLANQRQHGGRQRTHSASGSQARRPNRNPSRASLRASRTKAVGVRWPGESSKVLALDTAAEQVARAAIGQRHKRPPHRRAARHRECPGAALASSRPDRGRATLALCSANLTP